MKRRLVISATIALIYLAVCACVGIFVAEGTLHPAHRQLTPESQAEFRKTVYRVNAQLEDVATSESDSTILRAWEVTPALPNGDAVILLHGMGDNRLGMIGYANLLLNRGFTVLMPDARAHGDSGGQIATYGLIERDDVRDWFDWLNHHRHPGCIFGFAESMGAAQLLQALQTEPNFCAVAVESPFSTFREIAYDRMGQPFHSGAWVGRSFLRPVVDSAFLYVLWKYHLHMENVSPENAVAQTHVPVFLIHGKDDSNIPVRHSRRIRSVNSSVVIWEVPKTDHCGAISSAPREFENRLIGWFLDHAQTNPTDEQGSSIDNRKSTIVNSSATPPHPSSQNPPSPIP